jgi:outer membrane protein TolC
MIHSPGLSNARSNLFSLFRCRSSGGLYAAVAGLLLCSAAGAATSELEDKRQPRPITLDQCVETALLQNRMLQIERLNPRIARSWLRASYAYYDPVIAGDYKNESATDQGGFDPADFSRDAIYSADSEVGHAGLTGFLPGGMNYTLTGAYAHSSGFRNGLDFDSYTLGAGIQVRQPLLRNFWTDQGRMSIRINRKNLEISELGVRYVAMDVINQVQRAYYELAYAIAEQDVRRDLLETRRALLASVRRRIELGTLTILDEKLADAQVANVEADLSVTRTSVGLAENALKLWMGDAWTNSTNVRLTPSDTLEVLPYIFDLTGSWRSGLAQRPDLAQLRQEVNKAQIDLRFRRNQLFPSLDLFAGYGRKGASTAQTLPPIPARASQSVAYEQLADGDAPTETVGVIFSVPLGLVAERANYRASRQIREQAELRVKQYEEQVLREIADAVHTADSTFERVGRTTRARELAEAALAAEEQKLVGGKSTLFFVLELQNSLAAARMAEARAKADFLQAVSQVHFAEGSLLFTSGIDIRFD